VPADASTGQQRPDGKLLHMSELMTIDVADIERLVEEARAASADDKLIEEALELRRRVVKAQVGVSAQSSLFHEKMKQRGNIGKWRSSGGEERLKRATTSGRAALQLLQDETEAAPLAAAVEGLTMALNEAKSAGVQKEEAEVDQAERLLQEMREKAQTLERAHSILEAAVDTSSDVRTHYTMMAADRTLSDAISVGRAAHVDVDSVSVAENTLIEVRKLIRTSVASEEKLEKAIVFCDEQIAHFYAKKRSLLKVVALPALQSAVGLARTALAHPDKIRDGEEKLHQAKKATERVEEATTWLSTASKAGVKALARAAEDKTEAPAILQVAVESLASAIQGAKDDGAEKEDISSAEEIFTTINTSFRRARYRSQNSGLSVLQPAVMDKYKQMEPDPELQA